MFNPALISPYFQVQCFNYNLSGFGDPLQILPYDASRVLACFQGSTTFEIRIGASNSGKAGIIMPGSSSSPLVLKFADWGGIVCQQIYTPLGGAGGTINVYAVRFVPEG